MSVARLRLAPVGETMFPPRAPFLRYDRRDVEVSYERRGRERVRAVAGASLTVERGQIVGLVGESGCGKSSLARAAVGLTPASAGTILFEGRAVTPLRRRARSRELARLQLVFQNPYSSLNPRRKVGAQLADALEILDLLPRRGRRARVAELLELVGLPANAAQRYPHQFSGGQRQRLLIAGALACRPTLVIADEPTTALDVTTQLQILKLLRDLARDFSVAMLFVTHDFGVVAQLCDDVMVMYAGQSVEAGATAEIVERPRHPYTQMLLACHPDRAPDLAGIPGTVPSPIAPPSGCRFHPRCPSAREACRAARPAAVVAADGHAVRCVLFEHGAPQLRTPNPDEPAGADV